MKNWKSYIAGVLTVCLCLLMPFSIVLAEEETEEPIPDSYYYAIESNEIEGWPQGPAIESASAVVMDMDTETFLYSKQATEKMYPASTTKIMTTLLLLENCDLDDTITFSEIVYDLEEGSSHLGIQPGEELTIRDAAYGIMLASANDISNGIAEYIGGSLSGFAQLMNEKAEQLGCVNTHFSNPHGLYSEDHYTCAYDMALIAAAAYENPMFREIAGTREYTIPETNMTEEARSFLNHHKMMHSDSEYYQSWCTGGKTGFTSQCLNTLVTFAEQDGRKLVSVVFRVNGAGKAYAESTQIMNYALENFDCRNYEKKSPEDTFYGIMGLAYLGRPAELQSPVWQAAPVQDASISLTFPKGSTRADLTCEIASEEGSHKTFSYFYHGQSVGTASGSFRPIYAPVQLPFEYDVDAETVSLDLSTDVQIENLDEIVSQAVLIFDSGKQFLENYASEHVSVVIAAAAVLLGLVVISVIVLVFRCTANARIRRRRRQEEVERKRREEEIERMTAAEIEAELRAVMEQERLRREQQRKAERAAEETERINN